jgi:hypothetical protein
MLALTESDVRLLVQNWGTVCRLSKLDPALSKVVQRRSDGQYFLLMVDYGKRNR